MERIRASGKNVTLICYDIVSLRKINHAYGRDTGDALLEAVARYMTEATLGTVYRIEGDLYCVVLSPRKQSRALRLARKIEKRFDLPWELKTADQLSVLFINIVLSVVETEPCMDKEQYADLFERALEYSRKVGAVTVYDRDAERVTQEHLRLQMDLKYCIFRGMMGFDLFFQPIADPVSGKWRGVETLCRWNRPGHGNVPPAIFIKEAEEMGYIHNVGAWVLETAVKTCKELRLDCLDSFFVSVNISALQILRHDFATFVMSVLARYDFPCGNLLLEITESNEFYINDDTRGTIDALRRRGVRFALDDFGTGYSGFNSLKNMPADYLKTEREFIMDIEQDSHLQYFFYVMAEVAHSNGMKLIAEGVETKEQLDTVVRNGADLIQGYYFGRPLSRDALRAGLHYFEEPSEKMRYVPMNYMDFPHWLDSKEAYSITPALFSLLSHCMNVMLNANSPAMSLNTILGMIGNHFSVKRAYVFLSRGGAIFDNRYEWCADGVESQMSLLQGVDGAADGFYDVLVKNKVFMTTTEAQLPENLKHRLEAGDQGKSIQSLVVMPLVRKDDVIGFVGFDDDRPREWTPEEMILLHNLCLLVLIALNSEVPPTETDQDGGKESASGRE
ncbi:EAL domain-containing protein [Oscillospiraceae bacterium OttesenSCG-928-F05]|nr:EAL domain-containing protein [Oscillospiraceae bacterium OttesenSCG-928-F05]